MNTERLCYILLGYENELYTNIDSFNPGKASKLRLLGLDPEFEKYTFDDLSWIQNNCDRIVLIMPEVFVDEHTLAFEEVYKRVSLDKVYFAGAKAGFRVSAFNSLYTVSSETYLKLAIEAAYKIELKDGAHPLANLWNRLFIESWLKLFDLNTKAEEFGEVYKRCLPTEKFKAAIVWENSSFIIDKRSHPDLFKRLNNYGVLQIRFNKRGSVLTTLYKLYKLSNYKITPINVKINNYIDVIASFIYEPGVDIKNITSQVDEIQFMQIYEPNHGLAFKDMGIKYGSKV